MPFTSDYISQQIYAGNAMASGQAAYGQQLSYGAGTMGQGMAPPPPMGMAPTGMRPGQYGMYGEQMAMRMANFGRTAGAVGGVGMGVAGSLMGVPMDPFGGAIMGAMGSFGGGMAGMAGGAAMGTGVGAAIYGASRVVGAYTGAFQGGMQDQAMLNSTLRNNFQFQGGQGAFGRGFGQNQMGQIGSMIQGELRRSPTTNAGEMNSLVAGGAEMGMMSGVRDVQQFTQSFRRMLDTLRGVQRELGGTLTDALSFVRTSQQAGIYQNADRVNFAAEIRTAEAVTGMDRNQLTALAAQGSQISRAFGGMGRQGAMGAVRVAQTLGAAVQSGAVNQEMLSEATGGLTGSDAISAFSSNMLQRAGNFSRRGMGRFSLFALSNREGTGLDEEMLDRFRSGDLTTSEVSRAAHGRVGGMGRARALNREGQLRGAVMEEGGMAAQIGMMRLMVGDRVMDAGDDLGQLVMQRRFGMSRSESGVMMSLMRNQGTIAEQENLGRMSSGREVAQRTDIEQNRSFDAFTRQLEHGLSDATHLTAARELGSRFMTRISSAIEQAGNSFLGVTADQLSRSDRTSIARMATGRGSMEDVRRLSFELGSGGPGGGGFGMAESMSRRSMSDQVLRGLGMHTRATGAEALASEGVDIRGMSDSQVQEQIHLSRMARMGAPIGAGERDALQGFMGDRAGSLRDLGRARARASLHGGTVGGQLGGSSARRRGMLAFAASEHIQLGDAEAGGIPETSVEGGGLGGALDTLFGTSSFDSNLDYLASGGHLGADLRSAVTVTSRTADRDRRMMAGPRGEAGSGAFAAGLAARGTMSTSRTGGTAAQRSMLETLEEGGANRAALESVVGSEDFSNRVSLMSGLTGNREALREQITAGRAATEQIADEGQRNASRALYEQMERNVEEFGGVGTEIIGAARGRGASDREHQLRSELGRTGGNYRLLETALGNMGGAEGSLAERMRARLGSTGAAFSAVGAGGGEEELTAARAGARGVTDLLAQHDRSTPEGEREYREVMRTMRTTGEGEGHTAEEMRSMVSGLSMGAERTRQLTRDLSGRGRRGRMGAVDTLLSEATGGTFGNMEFTVGRGTSRERQVSGSRARGLLAQGGAMSEEILGQLETSLETTSGRSMTGLTDTVRTSLSGIRHGEGAVGAISIGETAGLEAVRQQAAQQSLDAARASSPLDAERNSLLTAIRDRLPPQPLTAEQIAAATRARTNGTADPDDPAAGGGGGGQTQGESA